MHKASSSGAKVVSTSQWSGTFPLLKKSCCGTRVNAPQHDDMVLSPNSALRENLSSEGEETTVADAQHQVEHQADVVSTDIPLEATASNDRGQEIDERLTDDVSTDVPFESTGSGGYGQEAEASESSSHGQQVGSLSLRASESGNHDQQDNEVSMEVTAADRHSQQPESDNQGQT
ncbi:hypothetical protein V6N12_040595 [Hibiscus sabdariffa]|uniref:Uncharacterized protein n=1 Tax=Hibiscus sabdariffa TaxID=183260 RepID=A0ABR2E5M0_9ROSI